MFLLAGRKALSSASVNISTPIREVLVILEGRAENLGSELVSFGLPLPSGFLSDPRRVRVLSEAGQEISAAVRSLEPWRIGGREGSIRSLLIQFKLDFSHERTKRVRVLFQQKPKKGERVFVPVAETLIEQDGLNGPRVLAVLPARWLCDSGIVGPQTPTAESGPYSSYDQFVERNFPGSLAYLDSQVYSEWLFDRTTVYYKMFARSGDRKFLEAAYHAAHFVQTTHENGRPGCRNIHVEGS